MDVWCNPSACHLNIYKGFPNCTTSVGAQAEAREDLLGKDTLEPPSEPAEKPHHRHGHLQGDGAWRAHHDPLHEAVQAPAHLRSKQQRSCYAIRRLRSD